jgi:hypothetical protein
LLIRLFKLVAVLVLVVLVSPALLAMSNCLVQGIGVTHCKPSCPMIEMSGDASDRVAATPPSGSSCCQLSGPLPGNQQAAITPRAQVSGNLSVVATTNHINLSPTRLVPVHGAAPPVPTSSHLALLCILLV